MKHEGSSSTVAIPREVGGGPTRDTGNVRATNVAAVKKIRAGDLQGALDLLRKIVYPRGVESLDDEAPACVKVNFAVALYLDHRWEAAVELARGFAGTEIETSETRTICEWYNQLSRWQRIKLGLGVRVPLADLGPDAGVLNFTPAGEEQKAS